MAQIHILNTCDSHFDHRWHMSCASHLIFTRHWVRSDFSHLTSVIEAFDFVTQSTALPCFVMCVPKGILANLGARITFWSKCAQLTFWSHSYLTSAIEESDFAARSTAPPWFITCLPSLNLAIHIEFLCARNIFWSHSHLTSAIKASSDGIRFRSTVERPALVHYGHRGLKATLVPHWAVRPIRSSASAGAHVQYIFKYKHLCNTNSNANTKNTNTLSVSSYQKYRCICATQIHCVHEGLIHVLLHNQTYFHYQDLFVICVVQMENKSLVCLMN